MRPSSSASPHDQNIDPAIAGSGLTLSGTSAESGGDDNNGYGSTKKGGKRELSTSKRAAQNRAAQVSRREGIATSFDYSCVVTYLSQCAIMMTMVDDGWRLQFSNLCFIFRERYSQQLSSKVKHICLRNPLV